ncbi:MAG: response regulator [Crocinitomicaceae bacterium]
MKTTDLKVLIVEDELIFAKQLESWLKKKVSSVFISTNSENGSFYISQENPDVIFLDNQLPGLNGIDVIEFYKEKSPDSILVLMSSVFNLEEISLALKKGADYVLNKRSENEHGLDSILEASVKTKSTGNPFWKIMEFISPEKSSTSKEIVILEDEEMFSFQLSMILNNLPSQKRHTVQRFSNTLEFTTHCEKNGVPDVLFLDYYLEEDTGVNALDYLNAHGSDCKTIIISSKIDIDTALNLNHEGVSEIIFKDDNWQESIRECATNLKL